MGTTNQDFDRVREQAAQTLGTAVEQARTPLLAALGAGDLAAQTVVETVNRVRTEIGERAEHVRETAPKVGERLDPSELRKALDGYTSQAAATYGYLTDRGQDALGRLRSQPPVQRAFDQVGQVQENLGEAFGDVRTRADDVLVRVARTTRSFGEKTARAAEETSEQAAESVTEAGSEAAAATRSTTRKAANSAEDARTGRAGTAKASSAKSGTANTGTSNTGTSNTGTAKAGTAKGGAGKAGTAKSGGNSGGSRKSSSAGSTGAEGEQDSSDQQ